MGNLFNIMVLNGGIADKIGKIIGGYVGPVFLVIVAGVSIMFVKEREFRKLAAFLGIAAIVGVLIYKGNDLFGGGGSITQIVGNTIGTDKGKNLDVGDITIDKTGGLGDMQKDIIKGWIGPVFILIVAVVAILFVKEREFRKLAAFLGIAAIVGIIIFAGDQLFGDKGKISGTINSTLNGAKTGGN